MSLALLAACRILPGRLEVFAARAATAVQSDVEFGFLFRPPLDAGTIKRGFQGGAHPPVGCGGHAP